MKKGTSGQFCGHQRGEGIVPSAFKPHPLLKNPHLQTIWPRLFHRQGSQAFNRQRLELADGDFLDLDWFSGNPDSGPIVLLIHGLGGSSASHYIRRVGIRLVNSGYRVGVFNLRGATGPNRLPRTYHSGETSDLHYTLHFVAAQHPGQTLQVAGFSLGANMLLKWLGENPAQTVVEKAVAVSVPFQLSCVADRLNQGMSRIYRTSLLANLKRLNRLKAGILESSINLDDAYGARTFRQYDDAVTAPLNGFDGAEDYYSRSSSCQYLSAIETPTLIVHAGDDPFMDAQAIPSDRELGRGITLEITEYGGHVGFISAGRGLSVSYWLPARVTEYLGQS